MKNTTLLRAALLINSAFSALSALLMLLWTDTIANLLGLSTHGLLLLVSAGLLLFTADLLHQALQPRLASWRALYASMADLLWVVLSVLLTVVFYSAIPTAGIVLVISIAGFVLLFALLQLYGIRQLHLNPATGLYRHCLVVRTQAPARQLWPVIADLGSISRFVPMLAHSEVLNDLPAAQGAVRRCTNQKGQSWSELCTDWQEGTSFSLRFLTDEPGFPFPASVMLGGWSVQSTDQGSEVTIWWELMPKPAWMAPVMLPMLAFGADKDFPGVIAKMAVASQEQLEEPISQFRARLLPRLC
ncbi:SRPBCC family protein [Alkalimonas amylolytica]|uniref:Polyketide cyclase / dehydrase and lipid transport n=1 Tax=Alkalimonas amylolytica TaxID=152573 RepID=A0A1H3XT96_ALKAM|nr:SRPBCC family protein [Alkalimonas amylolytica]SEA02450.1 Polyketide cyclase / dehydrase and lipid transport [Alkalimonas amylolytica]